MHTAFVVYYCVCCIYCTCCFFHGHDVNVIAGTRMHECRLCSTRYTNTFNRNRHEIQHLIDPTRHPIDATRGTPDVIHGLMRFHAGRIRRWRIAHPNSQSIHVQSEAREAELSALELLDDEDATSTSTMTVSNEAPASDAEVDDTASDPKQQKTEQ
eukprot:m.231821 g.231821  ORF g.231821 m.231821 type:complete len:156 (-) comp15227_c0_seq4:380-847(-)